MERWEYCLLEWVWDEEAIYLNFPDGREEQRTGSHAEVAINLAELGRDRWEVAASVSAGNWILWTLKRVVPSSC